MLFVAEVKSLAGTTEERQLRPGLGQVLRHAQLLRERYPDRSVVPVLVAEAEPSDPTWPGLREANGVRLVWPETLHPLLES